MGIQRTTATALAMSFLIPLTATAQDSILTVSPIPDGAENRFCYYEGLAYSQASYILLTGNNTVTGTSSDAAERLLECVRNDEGLLVWVGRSKVDTNR